MANEPDPGNDDAPDGSVDPDDMKNPDRSDEGRRRRETGSDDEEELGGREAAERLYGGLTDSESTDSDE